MNTPRILAACLMGSSLASATALQAPPAIEWKPLPPMPVAAGIAGTFAGSHAGRHFIAGGTNFPDAPPWEKGVKKWYDGVYTLQQGSTSWVSAGTLPRAVAHGTSHSTEDGIILVGGCDSTSHFHHLHRVALGGERPAYESLPPLPYPVAFHASAIVGDTLFVIGGTSAPSDTSARRDLLSLDLKHPDAGWSLLQPLPGAGRIMPVVASVDGRIYIAGGASLAPDSSGKPQRTYLTDGFVYTPGEGWREMAPLPRPSVAAPSPSPTHGTCFFVLGGDSGENLPPVRPLAEHPGFRRDILRYDTASNHWDTVGDLPFGQVTSPCYLDGSGRITTISGEIRPGVRTPAGWSGNIGR
jgi:N-acetylneuraminic acid mutarotase